ACRRPGSAGCPAGHERTEAGRKGGACLEEDPAAHAAPAEAEAGLQARDRGPGRCSHDLAQLATARPDPARTPAFAEVRYEPEGGGERSRARLGDDARNPPRARRVRPRAGRPHDASEARRTT